MEKKRQSTTDRSGETADRGESFDKLFLDNVKDLYHAEKQLVRALPKLSKEATTPELKKAFDDHLAQTEEHVARLEQVFELLGEKPVGKTCKGMMGLIEEGKELFEEDFEPSVLDSGIIGAAQKAEHYEIASYGTLVALAEQKGDRRISKLFQQTLDEEKKADQLLTQIAESVVNAEASRQ